MALSSKIRTLISWAFVLVALLTSFTMAFATSPTSGIDASSGSTLTTTADSTIDWGVDINLGSGPQTSTDPDGGAGASRQDHVMAIDPTNPSHVLASYMYIETGRLSYYANSTDAGLTWSKGLINDPEGVVSGGSTSIAFDGNGASYLSTLALSDTLSGLYVYTSTSGTAWSEPVPIVVAPLNEYRSLPILAVDQRVSGSNAGSVYVIYENYVNSTPFFRGIWGRYSRDGGHTWSNDIPVSDANHIYSRGPAAVTASDGTLYTAFEYRPNNDYSIPPQLNLARSTDGGVTWEPDRIISGAPIQTAGAFDEELKDKVLPVIYPNPYWCTVLRINHFPSIAVSPTNPDEVYAVWNDGRWETDFEACTGYRGPHSDVAFSRSTDGGLTWSVPFRVNDDPIGNGIDQYMPTVAVAPDGKIGISFYDRRIRPAELLNHLYYAESTDGGVTWSANQRVSDVPSDPYYLISLPPIGDLGLRKALVYGTDYAIASWLDGRLGSRIREFFIDRGVKPSIATPTLPPVATPTITPGVCMLEFADVPPGSPFYDFARCLSCREILTGYPCGGAGEPCFPPTNHPYFRPSSNVTRGQLSKIVSNAAGFTDPATGQFFEDVPVGSIFFEFAGRLADRGVVTGYPCGGTGEPCIPPANLPYFRPNANMTRGQMSKIVAEAAGLTQPPTGRQFEDVPEGSTFYDFIWRLTSLGIMRGYNCGGAGEPCVSPGDLPYFRPGANATRGQASKIVANTFLPDCFSP